MASTFFSWQSDVIPRDARNFIETALKAAIKGLSLDAEIEESLRGDLLLDKDTENVPGSPRIFQTILSKIDAAALFVADLTYIAERVNGGPVPNPNVLIEYGYALKSMGDLRIICVMNSFYGEPKRETMPFDLLERRWPITFDLPPDADAEKRKSERDRLTKKLEAALKAFFASDAYRGTLPRSPELPPPQYREPLDGRARFRARGKPIGVTRDPLALMTGRAAKEVFLDDSAAMWLRVGPQRPLEKLSRITDLEKTIQGIAVLPLCEGADPTLVWNSDGCGFVRPVGNEPSPSVAYLFNDGEIWAISTLFLKFYPELILLEEERYTETLQQCAAHLDRIGIKGPYRFVAGAEGVQGKYLPSPYANMRGAGPCTVNIIEESGVFNLGDDSKQDLEAFFAEVFDKCRARRPTPRVF